MGRVVPGAGQAQEDPEHVDQPDGEVLVGAEEDGGDLADQPHQPAGGEQQRRDDQPERVGDQVVLGIAVAVMPHRSRLLPRLYEHGSIGRRAGKLGNGGAHERHRRYWPGRTHALEDNELAPPAVGSGPGPAGRFGTPACCRTCRCWPPRTDVPPGIGLAIQAEVHDEPQHQPAGVASGDACSRPGAGVPAGFSHPRRHAVGEWRRRMPGTRPGQGNGHRRPAPAALAWRPSGLLPRGYRPTRPARARRRCPRRPTSPCPGKPRGPSTGRAETRGSGYRPARPPPRLARRERAEASARRAMCARRACMSTESALLRSEETLWIDLALELG